MEIELRDTNIIMKLSRLGSFHQSKLSFLRSFLSEFKDWEYKRDLFDLDKDGFGVVVYSFKKKDRVYSLICFANEIQDGERSDRVIATKWDAAFTLYDGVPNKDDIDRLIKGWNVDGKNQPKSSKHAVKWFENKINKTISDLEISYKKYRFSEALMISYKLVWDDFCSWYLEIIKPKYGTPIDIKTYNNTITILEKLLKILHPFMPFITEEIWHHINKNRKDDLIVAKWPKNQDFENEMLIDFENSKNIISNIRSIRKEKQIANKEQLELLYIKNKDEKNNFNDIIKKLANLSDIKQIEEKPKNCFSFMIKSSEYFIPLSSSINFEEEIEKSKKELNYYIGFLKSIKNKLNNKRFIENAPKKVVDNEKNKESDTEAKIKILEKKIAELTKN